MTNADKFKSIFGLYATELWAKPEKDFLEWLNADVELFGISEQLNDTISRAAVVDAIEGVDWYHQNQHGEMVHGANPDEHQAWYKADDIYAAIERVPSAQQNCDGCKWSDAIGYGECHHCKRAYDDMYEKGEQP